MKARGAKKNFCEIIARNVEGGGGGFRPPSALLGLKKDQSNKWTWDYSVWIYASYMRENWMNFKLSYVLNIQLIGVGVSSSSMTDL